jgi:hypothetical protein
MKLSSVSTALVFLAIPTLASAHGGNTDPNMVHACVGNVSKVVRIVGVSGSCLSAPPVLAETTAHWPQVQGTGSQGPKGDKGDPGNPGIQGPQGNPGTNGIAGTNGTNGTNGTHAAPPCFDHTNRYVDCLNGTVTDTVTGLIWLKDAGCLGATNWAPANGAAGGLKQGDCNLTDGSSPGDWRLPTKGEWSATIARAATLGCVYFRPAGPSPTLTNDAGTACLSVGPSSFVNVASFYWSSSTVDTDPVNAWFGNLFYGSVDSSSVDVWGFDKVASVLGPVALPVWPVRGGSR